MKYVVFVCCVRAATLPMLSTPPPPPPDYDYDGDYDGDARLPPTVPPRRPIVAATARMYSAAATGGGEPWPGATPTRRPGGSAASSSAVDRDCLVDPSSFIVCDQQNAGKWHRLLRQDGASFVLDAVLSLRSVFRVICA